MLAGGVSAKIGQKYEDWWTVSQMLEVLVGQADSIRIEDPGFEKSEFTVHAGDRTQLHQVKISNPAGKWTLATLGGAKYDILGKVLDYLGNQDRKFYFVSESQAPELHNLSECARAAASFSEFEELFLSKDLDDQFRRLCEFVPTLKEEDVFDRLKRVVVHTIDKYLLKRHVHVFLSSLFFEIPSHIEGILFKIADKSLLKTLTTADLVDALASEGFKLRELITHEDAALAVHRATEEFSANIRRKLIAEVLIERELPHDVFKKIKDAAGPETIAITGLAGSGKSAAMLQLLDLLRGDSIPCLAVRLDRLNPSMSQADVGARFGLEESPAALLSAAAKGQPCVILVDQLDAVSTVSGRQSDAFDLLANLLDEIEGLRIRSTIHVVLSCRAFDWENDHRLRKLISEDDVPAVLGSLSDREIDGVLKIMPVKRDELSEAQIKLLGIPQNLSLFYDTRSAWEDGIDFGTGKDLFDAYWSVKRQRVNQRVSSTNDSWPQILKFLTDEMTGLQTLSVPKETLDDFPVEYVDQMTSEGVIVQDGVRVAFGHESFLDYCFARNFIRSSVSLGEHVQQGGQKLFLRAQVRQVLNYLRDSDPKRYRLELESLLKTEGIRPHIKDLALTLVFSYSEILDEEWKLLFPIIEKYLSRPTEERNFDTLGTMTWRRFFASDSWFQESRVKAEIKNWLRSDREDVVNIAVNYLRFCQRKDGNTVAELLEPFVAEGGDWPLRLNSVMIWADHENSRRFFELFLRLVENGTLDEARGPIAQNSTFWSMMYGLGARKPEWLPELIAHWLKRRLAIVEPDKVDDWKNGLFGRDESGMKEFSNAAKAAPSALVAEVLPIALEIAERFTEDGQPPIEDKVWSLLWGADSHSLKAALRKALANSLSEMVRNDPSSTDDIRSDLRGRSTDFSNQMLLTIYASGAEIFAEEGAELISDQKWRLECGFGDGPYTIAKKAVGEISKFCSQEHFEKIEEVILNHPEIRPENRASAEFKRKGRYTLLSALETDRLTSVAKRKLGELEREFGAPFHESRGVVIRSIGSPINEEACSRMTDEQWLSAISKYNDRGVNYGNGKGGARELACQFQAQTKRDPKRFAELLGKLPEMTNPNFYERHLAGLAESDASDELKLESVRKAYAVDREFCGSTLTGVLAGITVPLTDEFIEMIVWTATEHPNPEPESGSTTEESESSDPSDSVYSDGINSTRGQAMNSIANLIWKDKRYSVSFRPVLERAVGENSKAVVSCVAQAILAFTRHHEDEALKIFKAVIGLDAVLLTTPACEEMLYRGIPNHFSKIQPFIECLLFAENTGGRRAGGRLSALSVLWKHEAAELLEIAESSGAYSRLGVCEVASKNVADPECLEWSFEHLFQFFNDEDRKIRHEAAQCFRNLDDLPLNDFTSLFSNFGDSAAFETDSWAALHALEKCTFEIASVAIPLCEKFLERFSNEARDISTARAGDLRMVSKLLFRIYQQSDGENSTRALDLIDLMVIEGVSDVDSGFSEFER